MNVVIVGSTGLCGKELVKLLESSEYAIKLKAIASSNSAGTTFTFRGKHLQVEALSSLSFQKADIIFFAAGSKVSKQFVKLALLSNAVVIDLSSAFRKDADILLIVPEVNGHLINQSSKLICSPNCTTTMLLTALFPLHKEYQLKSIVTSTYQAASGGGYALLNQLLSETKSYFSSQKSQPEYAFNVYPHPEASSHPDLSCEEEKMISESKKILNDDSLEIYPTCVRVPTLRSHCLSIHASFYKAIDLKRCLDLLESSNYLKLCKKCDSISSENSPLIYCSKVRKVKNDTIEMWVSGDQLLKGAAFNAFQIFDMLLKASKQAITK